VACKVLRKLCAQYPVTFQCYTGEVGLGGCFHYIDVYYCLHHFMCTRIAGCALVHVHLYRRVCTTACIIACALVLQGVHLYCRVCIVTTMDRVLICNHALHHHWSFTIPVVGSHIAEC